MVVIGETNKNNSNKKLAIVMSILLVSIITFGVSFAFFSDVTDPISKTLTAGTLDLVQVTPIVLTCTNHPELNVGGVVGAAFDSANPIVPGDEFGLIGTIKNNGTVDMSLRVDVTKPATAGNDHWTTTDTTSGIAALPPGQSLVLDNMVTLIYDYGDATSTNDNTVQGHVYDFTIKVDAIQTRNANLPGDWSNIVTVHYNLP